MGLQRVGHDWATFTPDLGLCNYTDCIFMLVKCWFTFHTVLSRTSTPFRRGDVKGRNVWGNSVNGDNVWTWYTSSRKELRSYFFSLGFKLLLLFCLICFRHHRYLFTCFSAVWLFYYHCSSWLILSTHCVPGTVWNLSLPFLNRVLLA